MVRFAFAFWACLGLNAVMVPAVAQSDPQETVQWAVHLPDNPDDVVYDPAYPGPKDHAYLDALLMQVGHNTRNDTVVVEFRLADLTTFNEPPTEWSVTCYLIAQAHLADTTETGEVSFAFSSHGHTDRVETRATFRSHGSQPARPLSNSTSFDYSKPGVFRLEVERHALLAYTEVISNFGGQCAELYVAGGVLYPQPVAPSATSLFENRDVVAQDESSVLNLTALSATNPESTAETYNTVPAETEGPRKSTATPGPPLLLAVAAAATALLWRKSLAKV